MTVSRSTLYVLVLIVAALVGFGTGGWSWYDTDTPPPCSIRWFEDGSGLRICGDVRTPIPNNPVTDGPWNVLSP